VQTVEVDGLPIRVTSVAWTVVDCFGYLKRRWTGQLRLTMYNCCPSSPRRTRSSPHCPL